MNKATILSILSFIFLVTFSACSQDSSTTAETNDKQNQTEEVQANTIEITDAAGNQLTFDEVPESIATIDSGVLNILQELDANITGRPSTQAPVDEELEQIDELGNPHQPNFEMIAKVNPEVLVVPLSFKQYESTVQEMGIDLLYTKANSIEDIQETIDSIGTLLNKEKNAETINQSITDQIEQIKASNGPTVKTLLVYGAPGTYLAALPNSLSGNLLEVAGGENIAADFPQEEKYPQYASISSEKIVERNPELIMLITHGDPEAVEQAFLDEMNKDATWKNLDAIKNDRIIVLPSHLFGTNPGTKVADALEFMHKSLAGENEDGSR